MEEVKPEIPVARVTPKAKPVTPITLKKDFISSLSEEQKLEFRTAVGKVCLKYGAEFIADYDLDGDGKVSWDEYYDSDDSIEGIEE